MVGHEAETQHGHWDFNAGMGQGLEEGLIVGLLPKHRAPAVAPVDDVATDPAHRGSRGTVHGRGTNTATDRMPTVDVPVPVDFPNNKSAAPPYSPSLSYFPLA